MSNKKILGPIRQLSLFEQGLDLLDSALSEQRQGLMCRNSSSISSSFGDLTLRVCLIERADRKFLMYDRVGYLMWYDLLDDSKRNCIPKTISD